MNEFLTQPADTQIATNANQMGDYQVELNVSKFMYDDEDEDVSSSNNIVSNSSELPILDDKSQLDTESNVEQVSSGDGKDAELYKNIDSTPVTIGDVIADLDGLVGNNDILQERIEDIGKALNESNINDLDDAGKVAKVAINEINKFYPIIEAERNIQSHLKSIDDEYERSEYKIEHDRKMYLLGREIEATQKGELFRKKIANDEFDSLDDEDDYDLAVNHYKRIVLDRYYKNGNKIKQIAEQQIKDEISTHKDIVNAISEDATLSDKEKAFLANAYREKGITGKIYELHKNGDSKTIAGVLKVLYNIKGVSNVKHNSLLKEQLGSRPIVGLGGVLPKANQQKDDINVDRFMYDD